eukprot:3826898-Rhodomonas_salina.1
MADGRVCGWCGSRRKEEGRRVVRKRCMCALFGLGAQSGMGSRLERCCIVDRAASQESEFLKLPEPWNGRRFPPSAVAPRLSIHTVLELLTWSVVAY